MASGITLRYRLMSSTTAKTGQRSSGHHKLQGDESPIGGRATSLPLRASRPRREANIVAMRNTYSTVGCPMLVLCPCFLRSRLPWADRCAHRFSGEVGIGRAPGRNEWGVMLMSMQVEEGRLRPMAIPLDFAERSSRFARWLGDCRATWTAAPSAGPAFRGTSV